MRSPRSRGSITPPPRRPSSHDLDRAIDLLKTLPSEEERERVAVYMDGLSQMRSEWAQADRGGSRLVDRPYRFDWTFSSASAPRGASGTFRSVESFFTSESLSRCIRFSVSATGVLEFFTSASTTE